MNQEKTRRLMDTVVTEARVALEPLDAHFISSTEAAFKDDYLTLLAALLLENGALTEAQQRLLLLLLPAIGPSFPLSHYLQQAAKLDAAMLTRIIENIRSVKQSGLALLFDFAVLQRLAGPLTPHHVERLSWLAKLTGVTEEQILQINFWSMKLLGVKTPPKLFTQITKRINIANIEVKYLSINTSSNGYLLRSIPHPHQFFKKGKYAFNHKLTADSAFNFLGEKTICRSVTLYQSGFVMDILMDAQKSKNEEYGKKGEAIFDIIELPPAFNTWHSFFIETYHE